MKKLVVMMCALTVVFGPALGRAANDAGLVTAVAQQSGLSQDEARKQVDTVFAGIKAELLAGRPITVRNFGRFYVSELGPREVRNPRTGQKMQIEARKYPKFTSADTFKEEFRSETAAPAPAPAAAAAKAASAAAPAAVQEVAVN